MNCHALLEDYLRAVGEHSEVHSIGDECILVTPYLHSHGVYISVYARMEGRTIALHDNAETIQSLYARGVRVFDSPHREKLLADICGSYGVEISDWTVQRRAIPEEVGEGIIDLINALKSINDLVFLHQATSSDVLRYEVSLYFKEKDLRVKPNHRVTGRTTSHKIDFYHGGEKSDTFVNVLSGTNLHSKVVRSGFSFYDIKEARRAEFSWVSIISPEDEWNNSTLRLLGGFSQTVSWEHKDKLIELLA